MTKNWHVGKILLLWAVDLMILGMVLWGLYRPARKSLWGDYDEAYIPYKEFGVWLVVLSLPLVVLTWRWLTWRERQQGSENRREDRRLTGLTLERGLQWMTKIVSIGVLATAVVSIGVLAIHVFLIVLVGWNQARISPSGNRTVYVSGVGVVAVPADSTEAEIKEALDNAEKDPTHDFIGDTYKVRGMKGLFFIDDLPDRPGFPISIAYVYQPRSGTTPSILYSRSALLQAEAKGELSPEGTAILSGIRQYYKFSHPLDPLRDPFGG